MRLIKHSSDEYEKLYCPSTDEVILSIGSEELNYSAKAVFGYWNGEYIQEPTINDEKLKASWEEYLSKFSSTDKRFDWDDLLQFLADYENPNWLVYDCSYDISVAASCFCFVVKADTIFEDEEDEEDEAEN